MHPGISWIFLTAIVTCVSVTRGEPDQVRTWEFHSTADASGWIAAHDVKEMTVGGDALRVTLKGPDAYIFSPPISMPLDGCLVRVRLRSDRDGDTQCYWRTSDAPNFEQRFAKSEMTSATPPGTFQTVEFAVGKAKDADKTLVQVRIDPFNGNTEGTVEIQSIELLRARPVIDVRFSFESAQVDIGQPVKTRMSIRELGGARVRQPLLVGTCHGDAESLVEKRFPSSQPVPLEEYRFDKPGVTFASAWVRMTEEQPSRLNMAAVIVGKHDRLPLIPGLRSERTSLDFIRAGDESHDRIGGARWQIRDSDGEWRQCGWLLPLFSITDAIGPDKPPRHWTACGELLNHDERHTSFRFQEDSHVVHVDYELVERNGLEAIDVRAELTHTAGWLFDFSGPALRCARERAGDPLDRHAIFGGIEFLEPGWPSSGERGIGHFLADRWSPWPFKIAMPVMAVEAAGITTAMMWDPQQQWIHGRSMSAATFASPNFLDGQPNHLMELSAPAGKNFRLENSSCAQKPLELKSDDRVTLQYTLYAEADLPVAMISKRYYELFEPPPITPAPHSERETYNLIARNFGETMYETGKGWVNHWFMGEKPHPHNGMAGELIAYAIETKHDQWIKATQQSGRGIIEAVGSIANSLALEGATRSAVINMRPDGTWAFLNSQHMRQQAREFTQGAYDSLGEDGSTSLGTCVQTVLPLINYVLLTGEEKYVAPMTRALEAMRRFRVPRGAQVWEVHQEIPDIRAAALAVEAYQKAFEITGDSRYLDDASYWAWTGVPFIYSWHVPLEDSEPGQLFSSRNRSVPTPTSIPFDQCFEQPQRRITPYATIPVLGPTFYVVDWFGVPVQWCGLEWAWKVLELQRDRPDLLLKTVADGVIASGWQQMLDRAPWVGLYPDSWLLASNRARNPLISAWLPLRCLESQGGAPFWARTWTRVVRGELGRPVWHVTGWGPPPRITPPLTLPVRWTVDLQYPPGQLNELMLAHVEKPQRVSLETVLLNELSVMPAGLPEGWYYDADRRLAVVRFRQADPSTTLRFDW